LTPGPPPFLPLFPFFDLVLDALAFVFVVV